MTNVRAVLAAACLVLAGTGFGTGLATAQNYPARPVRLIIPFPPGGSNDVVGRLIAIKLGDRLGKQVVVDNRGGAGGVIGTEAVGEGAAGRLHPARHLHGACGQSLALQAQLRPDQGFRPGRPAGQGRQCAGRAPRRCRSIRSPS